MFTQDDINQFNSKGISMQAVESQLEYFKTGFPFLNIEKPASVGDGMVAVTPETMRVLIQQYQKQVSKKKIVKFVPASGAATRMFKDMFAFLHTGTYSKAVTALCASREKLPFFDMVMDKIREQGKSITDDRVFIENMLGAEGLNYGQLPKALIHFHRYNDGVRTALEEHLVEGALYACNEGNKVYLHFTVSAEHLDGFKRKIAETQPKYEKLFGVTYDISFSTQLPQTDTIAVNMDLSPFRKDDGQILFRPGGHGALLENLNAIDADIIFIKNIDNVVPDKYKSVTVQYKKVLASLLFRRQKQLFSYMEMLQEPASDDLLAEIETFFLHRFATTMPLGFSLWQKADKQAYLLSLLNRPIRVCGMVKNQGEPGGGPFWVKKEDGSLSLQIAESSQIDLNDPMQADIVQQATHFNPVDVVCGVKDYQGNKFDLLAFRDLNTGFITQKSKDGKDLKAQELPGLWNGAMANWNTAFVEVPIATFNPVKTVNDLLREQHQSL